MLNWSSQNGETHLIPNSSGDSAWTPVSEKFPIISSSASSTIFPIFSVSVSEFQVLVWGSLKCNVVLRPGSSILSWDHFLWLVLPTFRSLVLRSTPPRLFFECLPPLRLPHCKIGSIVSDSPRGTRLPPYFDLVCLSVYWPIRGFHGFYIPGAIVTQHRSSVLAFATLKFSCVLSLSTFRWD